MNEKTWVYGKIASFMSSKCPPPLGENLVDLCTQNAQKRFGNGG